MNAIRIGAFNIGVAHANFNKAAQSVTESIGRIASGQLNMSTDAPSSIPFTERIRAKINEMTEVSKIIQDKMGALATARSEALLKVDVMHRIKELAVAYKNDTLTDSEKDDIQTQVDELGKLLHKDRFSDITVSTVVIAEKEGLDIDEKDIISNRLSGGTDYVIYSDEGVSFDLNSMLSSNSAFISDLDENSSGGSLDYSFASGSSLRTEMITVERHAFDLDSEGVLSSIDKSLESYASSAAGYSRSIAMMEYTLDEMANKKAILTDVLNRYTATDLAQETADMMKNKVIMQVGAQVIKMHQNLEKEMVFNLLSQMQPM